MKRLSDDLPAIQSLLRPETDLERHLLWVPEFRYGLLWGEPRFGHPEGQVGIHIREVLDNIDLVPGLTPPERLQLRLVALVHDTFKYAEDRSRPRDWSKHHGVLARRFLEPYTNDAIVLDLIETHDDAYYAWLNARHDLPTQDGQNKTLEKQAHIIRREAINRNTRRKGQYDALIGFGDTLNGLYKQALPILQTNPLTNATKISDTGRVT